MKLAAGRPAHDLKGCDGPPNRFQQESHPFVFNLLNNNGPSVCNALDGFRRQCILKVLIGNLTCVESSVRERLCVGDDNRECPPPRRHLRWRSHR